MDKQISSADSSYLCSALSVTSLVVDVGKMVCCINLQLTLRRPVGDFPWSRLIRLLPLALWHHQLTGMARVPWNRCHLCQRFFLGTVGGLRWEWITWVQLVNDCFDRGGSALHGLLLFIIMPLGQHSNSKSYKTHKKDHRRTLWKNYKYTSTDAINACVTASFILSLVEVSA